MLRNLVPSVPDWVFVSILGWLFFIAWGSTTLLGDGDTGWHIRTGEHILATGEFPREDLFSFSMAGRQWFAWEWGADIVFALLHKLWGLKGIVLLGGFLIAATAAALTHYMLWLRVNVLLAIVAMMAASSASTLHWLARPHAFSWGLFLATIWLLEADRLHPTKRVWALIPLAALWVNLHGGFVALLVCVGIYGLGVSLEQIWQAYERGSRQLRSLLPKAAPRYALLLTGCFAATLVNPYGWELHSHIGQYLQSDFILDHVVEFQAPTFRGENQKVFEAILILGLSLTGILLKRKEFTLAILILAWAHASLTSVRHAPLFVIVAAPLLARHATELLDWGADRGNVWLSGLKELAEDYAGKPRTGSAWNHLASGWLPLAGMALVAVFLATRADDVRWQAEFPAVRFPAMAADSLEERLISQPLLSTDQWGDYLIYRFHPEMKVFIDGRSDFYDPAIRDDYVRLLDGDWRWDRILARYQFDAVLLPSGMSLTTILKAHPGWSVVYDDGRAVYFERHSEARELESASEVLSNRKGQGPAETKGFGLTKEFPPQNAGHKT